MILKTSHPSQKNLTHLTQINGIEKEVFWVGRNINFIDAIFCLAQKNALRTEWMRRTDWKFLQYLPNPRL